MASKKANESYLEKAENLTAEAVAGLLSRLSGKLPKRLDKNKISRLDALAMQLEIEDEQLSEWRERMYVIQSSEAVKSAQAAIY